MLPAAGLALLGAMPQPHAGGAAWTKPEILRLDRRIDALLHARALRGAQVGCVVVDTVRGTPIYASRADDAFLPASNFKLLVGSAALQTLGPNFSYVTTVLAGAAPRDGVIRGNLYLRGGGDALLRASDLQAAAVALARDGIVRVTGSLVIDVSHDDSQRWGYGWSWDDLPYSYAPVVSALELEDGVVHVRIKPGQAVGEPAVLDVWPRSRAFSIENRVRTGPRGSADTSDVERRWNAPRTIELIGSYPLDGKESDDLAPSVPDPPSYAGRILLRAMRAQHIDIGPRLRRRKTPAHRFVLWSHESEMMPALLRDFWYPSDNLMGELLLKELGVARAGEPGTDASGATVERRFLRSIGVDPSTVTIADGSGLSEYDRITPHDLVAILQHDWHSRYRTIVVDALPLAGVRGTLKRDFIGTPAQGKVFAKTGSMNHTRTLSGFIQTRTHGVVTFSLLIDQWMGGTRPQGEADLTKLRGAVLSAIASQ